MLLRVLDLSDFRKQNKIDRVVTVSRQKVDRDPSRKRVTGPIEVWRLVEDH